MALIAPSSTISPKSLAIFDSKNATNKKKFFVRMVSNGYAGRGASRNEKIYKRLDSCLVVPPPTGKKPKALIKFLGGAFVGAAPEVTYSYLMELLAKEGYLIVSVPYNVTFDHERAAKEVYERFHSCMEMLFSSGLPYANISASELVNLPLYSVGHSNGALLQLLVGCYFAEKIPKANAVVSFNNRPASEAVPYFEQLGPAVSQVMPIMEASPFYSMARDVSGNAWKTLLDTTGTLVQEYDQEIMMSLNKFVDQLPSVMGQVSQGTSEFRPTPSENRLFFKQSYNVPHTLLVKFSNDAIDETDTVEQILSPRVDSIGGTLKKITLSGNHLTPCLQELKWAVGHQYTPADALAQSLKSISLNDTRVLARTISDWFQDLQP
ncbi:alpha/beta-Hydrolases protein [Dioscorea alata]|uniref:Alpha/beta-Hydrolases protein n=1 Tax=Dioscorea alata TaxID=55571 RepID=A0ACB7U538_DIOAL|nr:alpha/beta-Hydrolases protein [Dioscorea alata]